MIGAKRYNGTIFQVQGRVGIADKDPDDGADLTCLPMWYIKFADGKRIPAYPEEIIDFNGGKS